MYIHPDQVHRHSDGSIDFDRYRGDVVALRRQAIQETSRLSAAFKLVVIVVLTLGAVVVAPTSQDSQASVGAEATSAGPIMRSTRPALLEHPAIY